MSRNYEGPRPNIDLGAKKRDTIYPAPIREAAAFRDEQKKKYDEARNAYEKGVAAFADFDEEDRLKDDYLEAQVEASYGRDRYDKAVERDALAKLDLARRAKGLPSSQDRVADYEMRRRKLADTLNAFDENYQKNGITDIAELDARENARREKVYGKINDVIERTAKTQPTTAEHLKDLRDNHLANDATGDYRAMQTRQGKTPLSIHERPTIVPGEQTAELPAIRDFSEESWFQAQEAARKTTVWESDRKTLPWDGGRQTTAWERPTTLAKTQERVVADLSAERQLSPEAAQMREDIRRAQERDEAERNQVNIQIDQKNERILAYSSDITRLEGLQGTKRLQLDDAEKEIEQKFGVNPFAYQTDTAGAWKTAKLNFGRFLSRAIGRDDSEAGAALTRFFALNDEVMEEGAKIIRLREEMKREQAEIAALESGKALAPKGPTPGFEFRPAKAILDRRRDHGGYIRPTESQDRYSPEAQERARVAFEGVGYSPQEATRMAAEMVQDADREQADRRAKALEERVARDERLRKQDELVKASIDEDERRIDDPANWNMDLREEGARASADRVTIPRSSIAGNRTSLSEGTLPYDTSSLGSDRLERTTIPQGSDGAGFADRPTAPRASGTFRKTRGNAFNLRETRVDTDEPERVTRPAGTNEGRNFGIVPPTPGAYNAKWADNLNRERRPGRMGTMKAVDWSPAETVQGPAPELAELSPEEEAFVKGKNFGKIPQLVKAHFWREPERFEKTLWAMPMYYNGILQNNLTGFGTMYSRLNEVSLEDAKKYIADAIRKNANDLRGWWNKPGEFPTEKIIDAVCTIYEGTRDFVIRNPQVPERSYLPKYTPKISLDNRYASLNERDIARAG